MKGLMLLRFSILFLLIFADESAGGRLKCELAADGDAIQDKEALDKEEVTIIHERVLRANTRDYGNYDPTPAFSKPPFKLIPN